MGLKVCPVERKLFTSVFMMLCLYKSGRVAGKMHECALADMLTYPHGAGHKVTDGVLAEV